jgi:hypothetical protein
LSLSGLFSVIVAIPFSILKSMDDMGIGIVKELKGLKKLNWVKVVTWIVWVRKTFVFLNNRCSHLKALVLFQIVVSFGLAFPR